MELFLGGKDEDKGRERNQFYYLGLESLEKKKIKNIVRGKIEIEEIVVELQTVQEIMSSFSFILLIQNTSQ